MAVIRVNKTADYTVMSNTHFKEKEMSLKGKGLLSLMLSLPDDWDYSINGLCAICKENQTSVRSALSELEKFGYLIRERTQNEKGQFDYIYNIFEKPNLENQTTEKPHTENPYTDNHTQLNTNQSNTNQSNTKDNKERKTAVANSFDKLIEKYLSDDGITYKYQDADKRRTLLKDWLQVRKSKRAAMTDRSIELNLQKLNKLARKSNMSVVEYLEEVICRGWAAFFLINDYNKTSQKQNQNQGDSFMDNLKEIYDEETQKDNEVKVWN